MNALVIGNKNRYEELLLKLPQHIVPKYFPQWEAVELGDYALVFDLNFDDSPCNIKFLAPLKNVPVFAGAVKKRLAEAAFEYADTLHCRLIGMNTLPGFINRELMEVSLLNNNASGVDTLMNTLGWKYKVVDDRAGMVTPRIICMIINEAFYTLQEGTASIGDIDLAMKLGTNYPHGPFEWAEKIGIRDVYETLDAIYRDTRDERYKICPLLKSKYLKGEPVYSAAV